MSKLAGGALAALLALAVAAPVMAASKISGSLKLTTKQELASTGVKFDFRISDDADGKPEPIKGFTLTLPRGAKFDGRGAPRCAITQAEFADSISKNCPVRTRVGKGKVNATNGTQTLDVDAFFYNLKPVKKAPRVADIVVAFEVGGTQVSAVETTGKRNKLVSEAITGEFPGGFRVKRFSGSLAAKEKGDRNLLSAPAKCPESRRWKSTIAFKFPSGVAKKSSRSRCNQARVR